MSKFQYEPAEFACGHPLPHGKHINGLTMHVLEAGFEHAAKGNAKGRILLLHGFPELAYSWRKVMLPLAQAGYHVIAPDQRSYGQTTGWDGGYDGDVGSFDCSTWCRTRWRW